MALDRAAQGVRGSKLLDDARKRRKSGGQVRG